jgi:hypothetical protein
MLVLQKEGYPEGRKYISMLVVAVRSYGRHAIAAAVVVCRHCVFGLTYYRGVLDNILSYCHFFLILASVVYTTAAVLPTLLTP